MPKEQKRILIVSIGQSPRPDLVACITEKHDHVHVRELGLLDDKTNKEIAELGATASEPILTAKLRSGKWISLSRPKIGLLAQEMISKVRREDFDLIVFMSTGIVLEQPANCPMVNTQRAIDTVIGSVADPGDSVGLIYPLPQQTGNFEIPSLRPFDTLASHAPHGDTFSLTTAARKLKHCSFIVLNSVGYSEEDRKLVSEVSGNPVILPRQTIANSIGFILNSTTRPTTRTVPERLQSNLAKLTGRERQVMSLVCEGLSNKAIANQLAISHKTVEIHRSRVYRKMEATSSAMLIRQLVQAGLY